MKTVRRVAGLAALLSVVGCASTKQSVASEPPDPSQEEAVAAARPHFSVVESKEGGFRVDFPFPAEEQRSEQDTSAGSLTLHTFVATDPEQRTAWYVSYTDFPADSVARVEPGDVLARASKGAVELLGATDVSMRTLNLDGVPGQEVTAVTGDNVLRGRFYMVGPRLYQQFLIHPSGQPPQDAERFFSSFRLDPEATQALGGSGKPRPTDEHF
ncbi:hypothetical protein P2318_33010 [Myxococcaceae bacterium GXIMD 01537]